MAELISAETDFESSDIRRDEARLKREKVIKAVTFDGTNGLPEIRNTRNEPKKGLYFKHLPSR